MIAELQREEHVLLQELRMLPQFRRYEVVRQLLDLYGAAKPVGTELDRIIEARQPIRAPAGSHYGAATRDILASIGSGMRVEAA